MKISILCSDSNHPVNSFLQKWISMNRDSHELSLLRKKSDLPGGDILFLVSCSEIIRQEDRCKYQKCLVLHASDVPKGRGWSPHIWEIIRGSQAITLTLMEADDNIDCGKIWKKTNFLVPKHALWDEINSRLFEAEIDMIDFATSNFHIVKPVAQSLEIKPTYFKRRTPDDSQFDPKLPFVDVFDQIRVCDSERFPAFFDLHGHRYKLTLEKYDDSANIN